MNRLLAGPLLLFVACGCGAPREPARTTSAAPVSSTSETKPTPDRALCDRACAYDNRCGAPSGECEKRCRMPGRLLQTEVLELMVSCIEKQTPAKCDSSAAAASARRELKLTCMIAATDSKRDEAIANIGVFADAHCERTRECGVEGVFQKNECLGRARSSIGDLPEVPLLGALRPTSVDDVVACQRGGKCDLRSPDAGLNVSKCLDELLAEAHGPTP